MFLWLDGSTLRLIFPPNNLDLVQLKQVADIKPDESNGAKAGCATHSCKCKDLLSHPYSANHQAWSHQNADQQQMDGQGSSGSLSYELTAA